ncbi:MAG: S53 family peptidase [Terriglobales bacterium]
MSRRVIVVATTIALSLTLCMQAFAQGAEHKGTVVIPSSSMEKPGDAGKRSHTNIRMFLPAGGFQRAQPLAGAPPFSGYFYETPASIACIYKLTKAVAGCNPNTVTVNPTGGNKAIAIVDAYDDPNAASDLAYFSTQFGLPAATFSVVYASGTKPPGDSGWELEESLDIEWAHAMAPNAKLYLVEAASNSDADLFTAVQVASTIVAAAGGGEVSMSWGGGEFSGENGYDSYFTTSGVVYFASTGDGPGTIYPSVSPDVVAAGGTTLRRNPSTGAFISEAAWTDGGGGLSPYEARPSYQSVISSKVGSARGVPDMSAIADPNTGVWVYDSGNGGWYIVGGTSVSSPLLAGIVNRAGSFATSSNSELTTIYNNMAVTADFKDTTVGMCGPYMGYSAAKGWDSCTGVGSPKTYVGK